MPFPVPSLQPPPWLSATGGVTKLPRNAPSLNSPGAFREPREDRVESFSPPVIMIIDAFLFFFPRRPLAAEKLHVDLCPFVVPSWVIQEQRQKPEVM